MSLFRFVLVALAMLVLFIGCSKQVADQGPGTDPGVAGHTLQHTVVKGETLRQIADNYYGDSDLSGLIAQTNGITDPNRIVPGSVLILDFDRGQWQGAQKRSVALQAYNKGVDLMGQDRLAEAEKQFRLALNTALDLQSASYNLALVLSRRGKNSEALEILENLVTQNPEETDFHFACGHSLFQMTRFAEATVQFEEVLEIERDHKRAAFGLARSLQEDGQEQKALIAWERYLQLDGTSSWADVARRNVKKLRDGS